MAERHHLHAPKHLAVPQQISYIFLGTNDDDLSDVGMVSIHEKRDFEYDVEETTVQSSTTSDE